MGLQIVKTYTLGLDFEFLLLFHSNLIVSPCFIRVHSRSFAAKWFDQRLSA